MIRAIRVEAGDLARVRRCEAPRVSPATNRFTMEARRPRRAQVGSLYVSWANGFVSGHGFSRADERPKGIWGLALG